MKNKLRKPFFVFKFSKKILFLKWIEIFLRTILKNVAK